MQLEPAAADDEVIPLLRLRSPVLETETFVEAEDLAEISTRKDRN
jgi:hypothetical protein